MTEIAHFIDLNLAEKLQDRGYRQKFFLPEASASIAKQLIALRKRRGLDQGQLAQLIGTQQPAISRIEKADYQNWSFNTLQKIAAAEDARIRVIIEPSEDILPEYETQSESPLVAACGYNILSDALASQTASLLNCFIPLTFEMSTTGETENSALGNAFLATNLGRYSLLQQGTVSAPTARKTPHPMDKKDMRIAALESEVARLEKELSEARENPLMLSPLPTQWPWKTPQANTPVGIPTP